MENYQVEKVSQYSQELYDALISLTHQLNPDAHIISEDTAKEMISQECLHLFVAKEKSTGKIVGMVSSVVFRIPYGKKARAEDMVVDEAHRGLGIAKMLMQELINDAKKEKVLYVDLSSKPVRESANQFYLDFGYFKRDTNTYRLLIEKKHES